jgi:histidine triad (HIT) family protein
VATDCLFCRIASGSIPSTKVDETPRALAFRDVNPMAPTHVLLIPREHVAGSAAELGAEHAEVLAELFALARRVAQKEGLERGWRLVTNVGRDAGQTVHHLHIHLLGGRPLAWPPG